MKRIKRNKTSGITLIALVVTVIVLLILAGISIQMITGNNGILTRTIVAKQATEEAQIIEEARMDILAKMATSKSGDLTEAELEEILSKYGTLSTEEERIKDKQLTTTDGKYVIPVSEIYNGALTLTFSIAKSGVGYYADLNGDGKITIEDDGIIFADLAKGASGTGLGQSYSLEAVIETDEIKFKKYEESSTTFSGEDAKFGEQKWLKAVNGTTGKNRFYVMALKDVDTSSHYWYSNASHYISGQTDKTPYLITEEGIGIDSNNKAVGRKNTEAVMAKFNKATTNGGWGLAITGQSYNDMFEAIATKYNSSIGWFVPSKQEWAAFAKFLIGVGFSITNYNSRFGLKNYYWSSSQLSSSPERVWNTYFSLYTFNYNDGASLEGVRLCTTF